MDRAVITESRAACKNYEECVVDAREQGYIFQPPPPHGVAVMPASPRDIVRNDVKEKLARGEVVMLPILLHQNR